MYIKNNIKNNIYSFFYYRSNIKFYYRIDN